MPDLSRRTGPVHDRQARLACEQLPLTARMVVALLQSAFTILREAEQQAKHGGLRAELISRLSVLAVLVNDQRHEVVVTCRRQPQ
jgi:hypothetical protein